MNDRLALVPCWMGCLLTGDSLVHAGYRIHHCHQRIRFQALIPSQKRHYHILPRPQIRFRSHRYWHYLLLLALPTWELSSLALYARTTNCRPHPLSSCEMSN